MTSLDCERVAHISLYASLVHYLVNLIGRDARSKGCSGNVEDLSCQPADFAHTLLGFGIELFDLVGPDQGSSQFRYSILGVIRMRYRLGNLAARGEGVDWSKRSCKVEGREWVESAGIWIRFRHDLRREEALDHTILLLVYHLVGILRSKVSFVPMACSRRMWRGRRDCYPIPLEAILGAKVAVLDLQF